MVDTVTPNLGLVKPEIAASPDTWGNKTNGNWDAIDSKMVRQTIQWKQTMGDDNPASLAGPWTLARYGNDTLFIDNPLSVNRQTGDVTVADNLNVTKNLSVTGTFTFGGVPVDTSMFAQTGDMLARYGVGARAGYVRLNGLSIGNASSGASERANADCLALFGYLWPDTSLAVSGGGRGASAAADWASNKSIATPDWRGYALAALGDMGSSDAGRLTAAVFGANPLQLGAAGGAQQIARTFTVAEMPSHYHVAGIFDPGHTHGVSGGVYGSTSLIFNYVGGGVQGGAGSPITIGSSATGVRVNSSNGLDTTYSQGGGGAAVINTLGPRKLCTFYIKL